ncbi:hypothetical protein [Massilia sp. Se16.2.3]|uniref:hypothetical protein n=1 Tax=Massilia sp. Se16.2.3 TaxID=2709303 RepID=UPI001E5ACAE9|nr:hypothetical protein [Massilia sp. Se16.2.3]
MLSSGMSARSVSAYDWSATSLGDPAGWPQPLRVAADLMFNTPLPMLLQWGPQSAVLCNEAYGAVAGPAFGHVPGGSVPPVLPPPLAAAQEGAARAWRGEAALVAGAAVGFGGASERYDLYFTPLFTEGATVGGIACALAPATRAASAEPAADSGTLSIPVVEDNLDSQYRCAKCSRLSATRSKARRTRKTPCSAWARAATTCSSPTSACPACPVSTWRAKPWCAIRT